MLGSADTAGMPDVKSRLAFFCFEFACQDQPLGIWLESTPDFSHPEMRAARGPFFGMRFGRILSLAFLSSSPVAALRGLNSDRAEMKCVLRPRGMHAKSSHQKHPHSYAAFLSIRRDSPSEVNGA